MSVPLDHLPDHLAEACPALRTRLVSVLGDNLRALWAYGAVTFDDRPAHAGDVDIYAVLQSPISTRVARAIDRAQRDTSDHAAIEWDAWYVLLADMGSPAPPAHALRAGLTDNAWALHRAHWLAGQYVLLHGQSPPELVGAPDWPDLMQALQSEFAFADQLTHHGPFSSGHAAYVVWQCCRIIYSVRTRDVVVSKRAAASWALQHLPEEFHPAIAAAARVYDGAEQPSDHDRLLAVCGSIVALTRNAVESDF